MENACYGITYVPYQTLRLNKEKEKKKRDFGIKNNINLQKNGT